MPKSLAQGQSAITPPRSCMIPIPCVSAMQLGVLSSVLPFLPLHAPNGRQRQWEAAAKASWGEELILFLLVKEAALRSHPKLVRAPFRRARRQRRLAPRHQPSRHLVQQVFDAVHVVPAGDSLTSPSTQSHHHQRLPSTESGKVSLEPPQQRSRQSTPHSRSATLLRLVQPALSTPLRPFASCTAEKHVTGRPVFAAHRVISECRRFRFPIFPPIFTRRESQFTPNTRYFIDPFAASEEH